MTGTRGHVSNYDTRVQYCVAQQRHCDLHLRSRFVVESHLGGIQNAFFESPSPSHSIFPTNQVLFDRPEAVVLKFSSCSIFIVLLCERIDSQKQIMELMSETSSLLGGTPKMKNFISKRGDTRVRGSTNTSASLAPIVRDCRHLLQPNGVIKGSEIARTILPLYPTFSSGIPEESTRWALASIDGRAPIGHRRVRDFVEEMGTALHEMGVGRGHRIALVLPNGPELALAILAICNWASCVPLNASGAKSELEADLKRCGATLVMGPYTGALLENEGRIIRSSDSDCERFNVLPESANGNDSGFAAFDHVEKCAQGLGIPFCGIIPSKTEAGIFRLVPSNLLNFEIHSAGSTPPSSPPPPIKEMEILSDSPSMLSMIIQATNWMNNDKKETNNGGETARLLSPSHLPNKWGSTDMNDKHNQDTLSTTSSTMVKSSSSGSCESSDSEERKGDARFAPNQHTDEVLVLFTSGTTGNKKLVPHTLGDMIVASATIALSWNLTPEDVNCNLMPLFHVGGIVRQVFSPILSGGCVICCPSFDPTIFWALLSKNAFNWYYAAPTMHQMILQTGMEVGDGNKTLIETVSPKLKMIANAAGGLLPSLAVELRRVFQANVLPSYGMTECMPISSPPASYQLEKPGTSGVPVGPEVAIIDPSTMKSLPPDVEGPICVRGEPCFRGYGFNHLEPDANVSSSFMEGGWFNTGDLGYFDSDGYLYITGRSKEVINRGGEIISPMEVEEAVLSHPQVQACAAFSALHDVLQEVVGIAIVTTPGAVKLDLPSLHAYLGERLAAPKWPQCLVYFDDLPKSQTKKVLRARLAQRLGLPELSDCMSSISRTFQASCPPQGTPLDSPIFCQPVSVDAFSVQTQLRRVLMVDTFQQLYVVSHPARTGAVVAYVYNVDRVKVAEVAKEKLDGYAVPSHICILDLPHLTGQKFAGPKPSDAVVSFSVTSDDAGDPLVAQIQDLFVSLLNLDYVPAINASFFLLGGGSMLASQLASKIRKRHDVSFSGPDVFHFSTCYLMAQIIRKRRGARPYLATHNVKDVRRNHGSFAKLATRRQNDEKQIVQFDAEWLEPENSWLKSTLQLIPICVLLPAAQLTRFFLLYCVLLWTFLAKTSAAENFFRTHSKYHVHYFIGTMALALEIFHLVWLTVAPLVFVMIKWIVIGRYRKGRYALWSSYYMRWWFVDMFRRLIGRGIWGTSEDLLNIYYRMLGAKIGKDARISVYAELAEFDLVTIGDSASIEYATVRPFGVDNGCMVLGPIYVGNDSSVGVRSVVAPFTSVPDDTHLGPVASSYDVETCSSPNHARYNRRNLPQPNVITELFVGVPIVSIIETLAHIPTFFVLYFLVKVTFPYDFAGGSVKHLLSWLCDVRCIPFFIGIRLSRALVAPFVRIGLAILVKRYIIGKFQAGARDTSSQWQLLRHWLTASLFSRKKLQEVAEIVGRHYEFVSVLYRMLGAKVGKRVFWPGHLPVFTGEFDLLEIGDDVVFGSRSGFFCCTVDSCEKVILCAGSNLSDNSFMMPGSVLGKNAVLGSNSLCPEGWYLPEGSVWFGSKGSEPVLLKRGVEGEFVPPIGASEVKPRAFQMTGDTTTLRPFGKASYLKDAPYSVFSLRFIIGFTVASKLIVATVHTLPVVGALHGAAKIIDYFTFLEESPAVAYSVLYGALLFVICFTHSLRVLFCFGIDILAKWLLLGQRKPGVYNYDECDYAQKWELYQILARIRHDGRVNLVEFLVGTEFINIFFRLCGCKIGKSCCLYPAGGDPYMSEPDLVEMGDYCLLDTASIICHLNTAGHFALAKITLEDRVTLRARSRIQQGVHMECGSMLLEKSLAMTGEVVDADSVWQGSPATRLAFYHSLDCELIALTKAYGHNWETPESTSTYV